MHFRILFLAFLLWFAPVTAQLKYVPAPKYEVRAVWLTTAAGLDWPHSTDMAEQQASLRTIVRELKAENFNTIFFQVRARGDAYYRSVYEPWAENLTGTLGKNPGWDPLAFLIADAHRAGMEVHAWFNVFKIRGPGSLGPSIPPHPSRAHPQWVVQEGREQWLDPGLPEVREYLINVALSIVKNYDVDGINFDYIRYPGSDFSDENSYLKYGNGTNRDDWRRSNVSRFVIDFYDRAKALKPMLKVGSSPLGIYRGETSDEPRGSYFSNYQDSQSWLRWRKHDYLAPQLYWNIGASRGDPDFGRLSHSWAANGSRRQVYTGIAAYKPDVAREIPAQIDSSRRNGAAGQAYFRFEFVRTPGMFGGRYDLPALIPPMSWIDSVPPLPPAYLVVSEITTNVFGLEWTAPPMARDSGEAKCYAIYRWTNSHIPFDDPRAIAGITTDDRRFFDDTVKVPTGLSYYYAVTALDKGNNESAPSNISSGTLKELLALKRTLEVTGLSTQVSNADRKPVFVAYRLAHRTQVTLSLISTSADGNESLARTIVNGVQEGGTYIIGLEGEAFTRGTHLIRLSTGESHLEQSVVVP